MQKVKGVDISGVRGMDAMNNLGDVFNRLSAKIWCSKAKKEMLSFAMNFLRSRGLDQGLTSDGLKEKWITYLNDFDPLHPDEFYLSWTGFKGASNLIANIDDQFHRHAIIGYLIKAKIRPDARILDYGCGTAALSLSYQKRCKPGSLLYLSDVNNLAREMIEEYRKQSENEIRLADLDLSEIPSGSIDLVICIDVLEHLEHPSLSMKKLHEKVRPGGLVLLNHPWLGHPEHHVNAPVDWSKDGGEQLISSFYQPLKKWDTGGLYKRTG